MSDFIKVLDHLHFTLKKVSVVKVLKPFIIENYYDIENTVIFPIETLLPTIINDVSASTNIMDFNFSFKIKNLFNENYVLIQHYPMPGRNFEINVNKTID